MGQNTRVGVSYAGVRANGTRRVIRTRVSRAQLQATAPLAFAAVKTAPAKPKTVLQYLADAVSQELSPVLSRH